MSRARIAQCNRHNKANRYAATCRTQPSHIKLRGGADPEQYIVAPAPWAIRGTGRTERGRQNEPAQADPGDVATVQRRNLHPREGIEWPPGAAHRLRAPTGDGGLEFPGNSGAGGADGR